MMLVGFVVVLAYLGAVGNLFICNQERNEYRHLFLWLVQYETETNALHYAVRISSRLF